jgi:hypothetical protein
MLFFLASWRLSQVIFQTFSLQIAKKSFFAGQISAIFNKNLGFWPVKNKIFVFCRPPQLIQAHIRPAKSIFFIFYRPSPQSDVAGALRGWRR